MKAAFLALSLFACAFVSLAEPEVSAPKDAFTAEERAAINAGAETHEFKAEVSRLMDIIIHSLYSNREVFLRELVSNAADASDKVRFMALTNPELIKEGEDLDIRIQFDKDKRTMTITDRGIGMTREHLKNNLGVVAKSGTTEFLEAAAKGEDPLQLIGQFGVGFYSVYLVADKVTVASKHADDEQHIWESTANSVFTVAKDPRGDTLGRGTEITLYMKEDAMAMLEHTKIKEIVKKYSQFIDFPIMLLETRNWSEDEVDEEATAKAAEERAAKKAEEEAEKEAAEGDDEDLEVSEEEDVDKKEEPEPKPIMKKVQKSETTWNRINDFKAIWTRDAKEVTDEEHAEFYKTFETRAKGSYLDKVHFNTDGEVSFKSLVYIQEGAEPGRYNNDVLSSTKSGVKLYVRRVLISEDFEDFLPKYMNFVKGVVDSDDLPINVSRETLAQNRVLKVIAKKVIRKVLEQLRKLASAEEEAEAEKAEKAAQKAEAEAQKAEDADEEGEEAGEKDDDGDDDEDEELTGYSKFWSEHGKSIKFGIMDDRKNKAKLTQLLRYSTSASDKSISLDKYVGRMPEGQDKIYYLNCESVDKCKQSPFIEKAVQKGFEVVFMTEVVDEYLMQHMTEFDGVPFQNVVRDSFKLDKEERKAFKQLKEEFKLTVDFFKDTYGSRVSSVKVSNKLEDSPCVVTSSQYGMTANMERIMKSQAFGVQNEMMMGAPKNLEINPRHPIMQAIKDKVDAGDSESVKDLAQLLLDGALLNSGFTINDLSAFQKRVRVVTENALDVDPDAEVEEEAEDPPEEDEEEEEEEEEEEVEEAVDDEATPEHEEL